LGCFSPSSFRTSSTWTRRPLFLSLTLFWMQLYLSLHSSHVHHHRLLRQNQTRIQVKKNTGCKQNIINFISGTSFTDRRRPFMVGATSSNLTNFNGFSLMAESMPWNKRIQVIIWPLIIIKIQVLRELRRPLLAEITLWWMWWFWIITTHFDTIDTKRMDYGAHNINPIAFFSIR